MKQLIAKEAAPIIWDLPCTYCRLRVIQSPGQMFSTMVRLSCLHSMFGRQQEAGTRRLSEPGFRNLL